MESDSCSISMLSILVRKSRLWVLIIFISFQILPAATFTKPHFVYKKQQVSIQKEQEKNHEESIICSQVGKLRQRKHIRLFDKTVESSIVLEEIAKKLSSSEKDDNKAGSKNSSQKRGRQFQLQYERMKSERLQKKLDSRVEKLRKLNENETSKITKSLCDSTLAISIASDKWVIALEILTIMKENNIPEEFSTYKVCLKECFEAANGVAALEIFNGMKRSYDNIIDHESIGLTVKTTCKAYRYDRKLWRKGLKILYDYGNDASTKNEQSRERKTIAVDVYNSMLSCMEEEKLWKESLKLLDLMEQESKKISFHPKPNIGSYHTILNTCIAARETEQAVQILLRMPEKGLMPNVYTFDIIMLPLARTRRWRRSVQVLDLMHKLKVPQSTVIFNLGISACAKSREARAAIDLFSKMKERKIKPDTVTFNTLIDACAKRSLWKDALNILRECENEPNVQPDIITYTNAIKACARSKRTNLALSLFETVKEKNLQLDAYVYTAVIDACSKGRMWQKALDLLDEMKTNGINPNSVTYSVAISACGNGGQWEKALDLLNLMKDNGMEINVITYNSAIAAIAKASRRLSKVSSSSTSTKELSIKALNLLNKMLQEGISPDTYSYSASIAACASAGRWEEALNLIQRMEKGGQRTKPNNVAYTSAISACGRSGEWEHALNLFQSMKKSGLVPDRVCYNTLLSAFMNSGKDDEAFELWNTMNRDGFNDKTTKKQKGKYTFHVSPDIITVTEVIGCLHSSLNKKNIERIDKVFNDAVEREIILSNDSMDTLWEIDLSGMSLPVARAACRFIMKRTVDHVRKTGELDNLVFITGVGKAQRSEQDTEEDDFFSKEDDHGLPPVTKKSFGTTALREYIRQLLRDDFEPPIYSFTPNLAAGVVQIEKEMIQKWIDSQ